jgi:hypothetical protein
MGGDYTPGVFYGHEIHETHERNRIINPSQTGSRASWLSMGCHSPAPSMTGFSP